jgi:hypothetical protein
LATALAGLGLALAGCSKSEAPAKITPEMEAEQKEAAKKVQDEESRMQKQQKGKKKTEEQQVHDEESRLQRNRR